MCNMINPVEFLLIRKCVYYTFAQIVNTFLVLLITLFLSYCAFEILISDVHDLYVFRLIQLKLLVGHALFFSTSLIYVSVIRSWIRNKGMVLTPKLYEVIWKIVFCFSFLV